MSTRRSPFRILAVLVALAAEGCDSGPPPLPPPLPTAPVEAKAPASGKKGGKQKPPADSEKDPDSGHRTRRKLLQDSAPKSN